MFCCYMSHFITELNYVVTETASSKTFTMCSNMSLLKNKFKKNGFYNSQDFSVSIVWPDKTCLIVS